MEGWHQSRSTRYAKCRGMRAHGARGDSRLFSTVKGVWVSWEREGAGLVGGKSGEANKTRSESSKLGFILTCG